MKGRWFTRPCREDVWVKSTGSGVLKRVRLCTGVQGGGTVTSLTGRMRSKKERERTPDRKREG